MGKLRRTPVLTNLLGKVLVQFANTKYFGLNKSGSNFIIRENNGEETLQGYIERQIDLLIGNKPAEQTLDNNSSGTITFGTSSDNAIKVFFEATRNGSYQFGEFMIQKIGSTTAQLSAVVQNGDDIGLTIDTPARSAEGLLQVAYTVSDATGAITLNLKEINV